MLWKRFLRYRPFVIRINRSTVNSSHKGPVMFSFNSLIDVRMNKLLNTIARRHGWVRNDSETHSTGVTGLHSRLRRSCNPVTQSRVSKRTRLCYWIARPAKPGVQSSNTSRVRFTVISHTAMRSRFYRTYILY